MTHRDKIIIRGCLVSPGRPVGPGWVELSGGFISHAGSNEDPPSAGQALDFGEYLVCPGFIDLHVHGGAGYDVMDGTEEALEGIARFHARGGTTAFLGATVSAGINRLNGVLTAAAGYCRRQNRAGAMFLGIHLEGPYLNPLKKGAHPPKELRLPDMREMLELLDEFGALVKMVTLAPELPGGRELVAFLKQRGVKAALGHSAAGREELAGAVAAGLSHATHMFNAMGEFRHRDPGTAGYVLEMPEITVDVIADGVHVHPVVIGMLFKLKGADKMALITDAIGAAGLSDGFCDLGGQQVQVRGGEARLTDGALAGSTLTMNRAVANMVRGVGTPVEQAVQMASYNPARFLGIDGMYGRLEAGMKANITVMDRDFNVAATFVEGKRIV